MSLSCRSIPIRVIVTGVGAIIGQGIVKSLRQSGRAVRVVGVERNPHSMGAHVCDVFFAKPDCEESSPEYLAFWKETLLRESVGLVLPGIEIDLFFLNANRQALSECGAVLGLNASALIDLARDKWRMGLELPNVGLAPIPTLLNPTWQEALAAFGLPFLLKPRYGNGSRGIVRINEAGEFGYWTARTNDDFMAQRIIGIETEEYTVGAFGFGDGDSLNPIIFRRKLSNAGNTQYAEVVEDESIQKAVRALSAYFKPVGPTNYQFRKEDGIPYLLEINPRLSSSTSLRAGFGYNESEMALDFYLNGIRPVQAKIQRGYAWRYYEDFFVK